VKYGRTKKTGKELLLLKTEKSQRLGALLNLHSPQIPNFRLEASVSSENGRSRSPQDTLKIEATNSKQLTKASFVLKFNNNIGIFLI
jgi:hypothetical protein